MHCIIKIKGVKHFCSSLFTYVNVVVCIIMKKIFLFSTANKTKILKNPLKFKTTQKTTLWFCFIQIILLNKLIWIVVLLHIFIGNKSMPINN